MVDETQRTTGDSDPGTARDYPDHDAIVELRGAVEDVMAAAREAGRDTGPVGGKIVTELEHLSGTEREMAYAETPTLTHEQRTNLVAGIAHDVARSLSDGEAVREAADRVREVGDDILGD